MKSILNFRSLALAAFCAFTSVLASAQPQGLPATKEVVIGISDAYVPGGFDSEADAYVVANGIFPNGCYRWKGAEVKDVNAFNHEVTSTALVSQGMCIMVLIPFTKEIRLGKLQSGEHHLKFLNGDGTFVEKTMKIE